LRWAFASTGGFYWQPLTWLSHMFDVELFGLNAGAHHLVNVLFHAVNSAVLLVLLWRITAQPWRSAFAAALFALHPLRVESVAWAAERKDVLSAFFYLGALCAYAWYARRPRSWRRYTTVAVLLALGLMSKPSVVTAPIVFLLLDYWPLARRERWILLLREKIPFFILAAATSVVTYLAQKQSGATEDIENLAFASRLANALLSYAHYLGKFLWPHPLAVVYPYPRHLPPLPVILACLLLAAITTAAFLLGGKRRYLPVGWLWFLATLVPMIGIIQVGYQAYADRFSYIPSIGIGIALVWLAADVIERRRWRLAGPLAAVAILPALAAATWSQLPYWHDDRVLWQHAVDSTSRNVVALYKVGKDRAARGQVPEAISLLTQAIQAEPAFYPAWYLLGKEQDAAGDSAAALHSFAEALRLNPAYADAYYARAAVFMTSGNIQAAAPDFRQALKYGLAAEWAAGAHHALGVILARQHDLPAATTEFRQAVLAQPGLVEAQRNLAQSLADQGRLTEAIASLEQALAGTPGDAGLRLMLDRLQAHP